MKCEMCTKEFDPQGEENACYECSAIVHKKWVKERADSYTMWKRYRDGYEGNPRVDEKEQHAAFDEAYADGREGGEG